MSLKEKRMKIYKSQAEVEKDVKDGVLIVDESVTFEFSLSMEISLKITGDIDARDIDAGDIDARDINAGDIDARNIDARDIDARNINARDIDAGDIDARNIDAGDINAGDIDARNILYYAFCCVYKSISCLSIKAKREKAHPPICLDGELKFKNKK